MSMKDAFTKVVTGSLSTKDLKYVISIPGSGSIIVFSISMDPPDRLSKDAVAIIEIRNEKHWFIDIDLHNSKIPMYQNISTPVLLLYNSSPDFNEWKNNGWFNRPETPVKGVRDLFIFRNILRLIASDLKEGIYD